MTRSNGATDRKPVPDRWPRRIAGILFITGKLFTDVSISCADLACIGEEDLGTGQVDTFGHPVMDSAPKWGQMIGKRVDFDRPED